MSYNPNASGTPSLSRASGPSGSNDTGSSIAQATPVRLTSSGVSKIDVAVEAQVDAVAGVLRSTLGDGDSGDIIGSGLLENISTSFSVGAAVYIGKDGNLTNIKPAIGANSFLAGDSIVRIGVITKNTGNPSNKDLLVNVQIVGVL